MEIEWKSMENQRKSDGNLTEIKGNLSEIQRESIEHRTKTNQESIGNEEATDIQMESHRKSLNINRNPLKA